MALLLKVIEADELIEISLLMKVINYCQKGLIIKSMILTLMSEDKIEVLKE